MASSSTSAIICNVDDFQRLAKTKLPHYVYEYIASGTDDEQTLAENRSAFKLWYLRPRVLRPVSRVRTDATLLGQRLAVPFFATPAGVMGLCAAEGECAAARACGRAGALFALSQHATRALERVAAAAPATDRWYQCYILKDREFTGRLLRRARDAGYRGIFLTVDSPRFGYREADARNGFNSLPAPHRLENYHEGQLDMTYNAKKHAAWDQNTEEMFDTDVTWRDVKWVKDQCDPLPVIIKGIMTAEDAELAVQAGADGVMVSNHGGRQLDGCLASIDALSEVVAAVGGRVPVLIDGGFRRGTDILKALALGATAVGIGKPIFFALSVGGEEAVTEMFRLLRIELEAAMALCGVASVQDISSSLVTRHPTGGAVPHYNRAKL